MADLTDSLRGDIVLRGPYGHAYATVVIPHAAFTELSRLEVCARYLLPAVMGLFDVAERHRRLEVFMASR